ncbi:MAG: hypothetical protein K2G37_01145 [Clostridia bacterium]|nr:hypothetical protein [Clostridia bacterium]MDE7329373.1 hypothetical protein [Clostridia bacterium]
MRVKFPQTLTEYTNGELWYDGVDEAIARRILFSLKDVKDFQEMRLRKKYLAHYYCERGDYALAINLCRQLLLEEGADKEVLLLMQFCCVRITDIGGLGEVLNAVRELAQEDKEDFLNNFEQTDFAEVMLESDERPNGVKVEFKNGWVEYYDKGKLIYKLFDNDYDAFSKDNAARRLLGEGKPLLAIAQLDAIRFVRLRRTTALLCEQTYVMAFSEIGEYGKAYEHCKTFFNEKIYIDAMLMLLIALKEEGKIQEFEELRRYISSLQNYDVNQMKVFFDYSEEYGDYGFWQELEKNNPLSEMPENDERLCLEGRALGRVGNLDGARKRWLKAKSIYGHFSAANYYLTYPAIFAQAVATCEGSRASGGDVDAKALAKQCREVVASKLKEIGELKEEESVNEEVLRTLNVALVNFVIDLDKLVPNLYKIYNLGFAPIVSEIDRLAACEDASEVNRAICLANYMMGCKDKTVFFNGENHKNLAAELKGDNLEIKYAIAMFSAHIVIRLIDLKHESKIHSQIKKIYAMIDWSKYPNIKAYAMYGFLLELFANSRPPLIRMPNYYQDLENVKEAFCDNAQLADSPKYSDLYNKIITKITAITIND